MLTITLDEMILHNALREAERKKKKNKNVKFQSSLNSYNAHTMIIAKSGEGRGSYPAMIGGRC